ncbi:hypothetical protein WS86_08875 [Burkholderia savannae]|nr:hypothetical protein WS86_08875 [Burkholderia savannae]KWZ45993.1 hypothetical protein WS73_18030 [Burkholderia savannae]
MSQRSNAIAAGAHGSVAAIGASSAAERLGGASAQGRLSASRACVGRAWPPSLRLGARHRTDIAIA